MGYILKVRDDKGNVIGIPAIQGENGKDGKDGIDGANGKDGKDGEKGNDGKSAYELAVADGFEGSVSDWLASLKGENGSSPVIGGNLHWWIDGEDTGVAASMQSATGTFHVITESTSETETYTEFAIALDFKPKLILGIFKDRYGMFIWAGDRFQFMFSNTGYGGNAPYLNGEIYAEWWNKIITGECLFVALA